MKQLSIIFFNNGNTFVSDGQGKQVSEFQQPWILIFTEFLKSKGVDPTQVEITLPNNKTAKIFETEIGYNWVIK